MFIVYKAILSLPSLLEFTLCCENSLATTVTSVSFDYVRNVPASLYPWHHRMTWAYVGVTVTFCLLLLPVVMVFVCSRLSITCFMAASCGNSSLSAVDQQLFYSSCASWHFSVTFPSRIYPEAVSFQLSPVQCLLEAGGRQYKPKVNIKYSLLKCGEQPVCRGVQEFVVTGFSKSTVSLLELVGLSCDLLLAFPLLASLDAIYTFLLLLESPGAVFGIIARRDFDLVHARKAAMLTGLLCLSHYLLNSSW